MKKESIKPTGLKGRDKVDRVRHLMETISPSTKDTSNPVELTKVGPDGKIYAIVRENQEFYIKTTDKKSGVLMIEDFNYIGGLQNKKSEAYPSYEKAIKHLNMKFHSINEALGIKKSYNVFKNDNLLNEDLSAIFGTDNSEAEIIEEDVNVELNETERAIEEIINPTPEVEVELSESEMAIDSMLGEGIKPKSVLSAIQSKDSEEITEDVKKFMSNLSEEEILAIYQDVKKKV